MGNLKFRCWDIDEEEMLYTEESLVVYFCDAGIVATEPENPNKFFIEIENFELMQSTGLKDKNDTEIYEGDIIQHSEKPNPVFKYPFEVVQFKTGEWRLDNFRGGTVLAYCNQDELEVIGNIFQNSELLEADSHE